LDRLPHRRASTRSLPQRFHNGSAAIDKKMPVIVCIHGGGNIDGESNDYDGSKLAMGISDCGKLRSIFSGPPQTPMTADQYAQATAAGAE
jgi:hypothetical protein